MKILVVEDEHKSAAAIKRGLEQEHFAVDIEHDSDEGLSAIINDEYDLIILDRMLPGTLDGIDICERMRAKKIFTPVLMLTAKDKISDRVEGLNAGADDYLVKPFSFEELLARVHALLRRPKDSTGNTLEADNLVLNTTTYQVTRDGKDIELSSKEYALLEYLLRHPGQVLSKTNIISHVWNFDSDILPNTVEVYIGYLRNKIDKPFKGPKLIHTVRGFGYKVGVK
jgi:DNA-binding response OmpR family regulator